MGRELLNPSALHAAPGFSHIAVATGSRTIYFAGQVALDPEFNLVGAGDLRAQTVAAMHNLEIAMREVNVTWDDVVRRTVYTTTPTEYETGLLIEIEATASL